MSSFADAIKSGKFLVTAELNPPKGTDLSDLMKKAELLRGWVDAFNLTDSAGANMTMAPIAAAAKLKDAGFEPLIQMTSRDRNRIAVQGDMLASAALGVTTIVLMGGDKPDAGDHPEAKGVFDLDTIALLKTATALNAGKDMMGNDLKGQTHFSIGATCNPGASDVDKEVDRMKEKIEFGATFFQTQAVYDVEGFERFMEKAGNLGTPVIAGCIIIKSGQMARWMNENLFGVDVPQNLIDEMDATDDKNAKAIEIGARLVSQLRKSAGGVHMMGIGWENRIPPILEAAGLERSK
jgi:methylenetetrahydrofolate reductase (NADPH)